MELKLKAISKGGIEEALAKVHLYRNLNEPEEAESICHDILAIDSENQAALRLLALTITDQFSGKPSDRYRDAERITSQLADAYERYYFQGLVHERRAKAQLAAGERPHNLVGLFEEAMQCFEAAERIRPPQNDDAILRWNRCVRILQSLGSLDREEVHHFDSDSPPM